MRTFKQFVESLCFLLATCVGLAFTASPFSFAKESGSGHSIGAQIGQVWPAGNIGRDIDNDIAPGLFYEFQSSDAFGFQLNWIRSQHSDDALKIDTLSAAIKANIAYYDRLAPYAFFGMGLYPVRKTSAGVTASKTLFGMNFGVGADLDLSDSTFVGMYFAVHNLFGGKAQNSAGLSETLSGRWSGFLLRGGLRF